jgi:hypothetical protein
MFAEVVDFGLGDQVVRENDFGLRSTLSGKGFDLIDSRSYPIPFSLGEKWPCEIDFHHFFVGVSMNFSAPVFLNCYSPLRYQNAQDQISREPMRGDSFYAFCTADTKDSISGLDKGSSHCRP